MASTMDLSRRQMLRLFAYCAIGAGIVLGEGSISSKHSHPGAKTALEINPVSANPGQAATTGDALTGHGVEAVKVKVMYFQMRREIAQVEEHFVLSSPARLRDLLSRVTHEHPVLTPMMESMAVLVDGLSARADTALNDGDEVDFISTGPGG